MPTTITIPEIKGNFYGGQPYAVDLQVGTFNSASSLTISVINDKGIYSKPTLSYSNVSQISLGALSFAGHLVEYKNSRSVGQKTLELSYEDCSCLLDKIQIGLHKRHGLNPNAYKYNNSMKYAGLPSNLSLNKNPYLIIVGNEIHPCDINKNGVIDSQDIIAGSQIDWCDPCPTSPPDKYKYRCKAMNDLNIFDVAYSFDELCSILGISIPQIPSIKTILRSYTGSLRSVLQSWCSEFALSFYWNFSATNIQNGLVLFDRSIPITVNTTIDECKTTEIFSGESIKNSFAVSNISYYEREGNRKNYECTSSAFYTLHPLTLRDLLNPENYQDLDASIKWHEMAICLSYYSFSLRDCMWWFNYYGIANAAKAKMLIYDDAQAKLGGSNFKILKQFGNMKIRKVISASGTDNDKALFKTCQDALGDSLTIFETRSKALKRNKDNPSYYFFVAEYDKDLLAQMAARDADLAENFLGNHWIKITNGPGYDGGSANIRYGGVSIDDPEGGASWYSATGDSIFADFAKYGHETGSKIDSFLKDHNNDPNNVQQESVEVEMGGGIKKSFKVTKSMIYKKRKASWYPNKSDSSNYQSILDYYKDLCFQTVGISTEGEDQDLLGKIDLSYVGKKNYAVFVVQEIDSNFLPATFTKIKNFLEPDKLKIIRGQSDENESCLSYAQANQSDASESTGPILGSYGLKNNECAWITFDGFAFMTPTQATELYSESTHSALSTESVIPGGYKVRATSTHHAPVCIPKIQQSMVQMCDNKDVSNAAKHELNFQNISDGDISIFENSCVPSAEAIKKIHNAKSSAQIKSKIIPEKNCEYQMVGVVPDGVPTISQGLDSIKISVNDNGVFTTFTLSDKISQPFSEQTIMNQILMSKSYQKGDYPTVADYAPRNAGNSVIPDAK